MTTILDSQVLRQPAERDLEVYRLVMVEGRTTRAAAECVGLSQTRVCQLVERVVQWLGAVLPPAAEGLPDEQRLLLAQQISVSRLDHLYAEAMAAWRESRADASGSSRRGDVRYLAAAMRISLKKAKMPVALLALKTFDDAATRLRATSLAEFLPKEDCSAIAAEQAEAAVAPEVDECGITVPTTHYEQDLAAYPAAAEHLLSVFAPVQTAASSSQPKPASPGLPGLAEPPRSRKVRRARQRLLEKRLRKSQ